MSNPFIHDENDIAERVVWKMQNSKSQCSIGKVVSINLTPVSVNVQPLINYFDVIAGWKPYPILNSVPVAQFQNTAFSINTPLNVGDVGLLLWFDREVYTCLLAGATSPTTPDSGDLSDLNACIFIPIVQPFAKANPLLPAGVDIISNYAGTPISLMTEILALLTGLTACATALSTATTFGNINEAGSALLTVLSQVTTALTNFKGAQP